MPKANFYILKQAQEDVRRHFACRLVEKAYNRRHKIYLYMDSEAAAQQMDDMLWSFKPESFLPHAIDKLMDEEVPIIIGYGALYDGPADMLINLSSTLPDFHHNFSIACEIVLADENDKQRKRQYWNAYREAGFELERHQL